MFVTQQGGIGMSLGENCGVSYVLLTFLYHFTYYIFYLLDGGF